MFLRNVSSQDLVQGGDGEMAHRAVKHTQALSSDSGGKFKAFSIGRSNALQSDPSFSCSIGGPQQVERLLLQ